MAVVGVDLGSSSIRVCYSDPERHIFKTESSDIGTTITNRFISQSSYECFHKLLELLKELPDDYAAISITATCSMVVLKKTSKYGRDYLEPLSCDYNEQTAYNDILLWMDNRPIEQTAYLNEILPEKVLQHLGGKLIPEMGLPKLKWISDKYQEEQLVAFELHDWLSYLLLVGGFDEEKLVPYRPPVNVFNEDSEALDGSIKGWSEEFLTNANIKVEVGQSEFQLPSRGSIYPIGHPLGLLHDKLGNKSAVVVNGCIDCYAGWVSSIVYTPKLNNSLSMIAGTSTCFLFSTTDTLAPISGVWGPFNQVLGSSINLFEFGQSATGKLFENLFIQYGQAIKKAWSIDDTHLHIQSIFQRLEEETCRLEEEHAQPIHQIIRNFFYYGDVYGNRSPYNDHRMSEMFIDGFNSSPDLDSINDTSSVVSLVIRYNLILEFLCFQIKQMVDLIKESGDSEIQAISVCGSQAKNTRFIQLLAKLLQIPIYKGTDEDSKYNVVKGSSIIAAAGLLKSSSQAISGKIALDRALMTFSSNAPYSDSDIRPVTWTNNSGMRPDSLLLLRTKYSIFLDMCEKQRVYRNLMDSVSGPY